MKTCSKCKETKPLVSFHKDPRFSDGRKSKCKSCEKVIKQAWYRRNRELSVERAKRYRINHPEWTKEANKSVNRGERSASWRDRNPEKAKIIARRAAINRRLRKYNITLEQYEAPKAAQNNLCAACKEPPTELKGNTNAVFLDNFVIDHDHRCCPGEGSCGKCIRGLTCSPCNVAAGMLRDNPVKARNLADYLENSLMNCGSEVQTDVESLSSGAEQSNLTIH